MKSYFKRSAIGLAVFSMTGSIFAMAGFIGVEGLDLRPQNGDLDVVRTAFTSGSPAVTHFNTNGISTDYNWDWRIFAGVRMGDDDLTISWLRLRASDSLDDFVGPAGASIRYLGTGSLSSTTYTVGTGDVNFHLDEVYGVWGHTVHFNNPWSVRFAAGLEYAHLESDLTTLGVNASVANAFGSAASDSDLKGWGPRAELDLMYQLPSNFMVFANSNAALLVSRREVEFSRNFVTSGSTSATGFPEFEDYTTRHVVIPKFGMRLGIGYSFPFGQIGGEGMAGAITLTAGWQVESYIHAIERRGWDYSIGTSGGDTVILGGNDETKVSNFGDQGLFLGVTFSS